MSYHEINNGCDDPSPGEAEERHWDKAVLGGLLVRSSDGHARIAIRKARAERYDQGVAVGAQSQQRGQANHCSCEEIEPHTAVMVCVAPWNVSESAPIVCSPHLNPFTEGVRLFEFIGYDVLRAGLSCKHNGAMRTENQTNPGPGVRMITE